MLESATEAQIRASGVEQRVMIARWAADQVIKQRAVDKQRDMFSPTRAQQSIERLSRLAFLAAEV